MTHLKHLKQSTLTLVLSGILAVTALVFVILKILPTPALLNNFPVNTSTLGGSEKVSKLEIANRVDATKINDTEDNYLIFADTDVKILWNKDVSNIYAPTAIVDLNDGETYRIEGNRFINSNGKTELILTNISDGSIISIDTGNESQAPKGLSNPALIDRDGNGTVDIAFAGDIEGNIWKFDLNSSNGYWDMDYKLFSSNEGYPIDNISKVTSHPKGGFIVYYYKQNNTLSNGIWDTGSPPESIVASH